MVRKPDTQYVHNFYVHGSEARVLELKPRRKIIKTILPKVAPDKTIRIGVDPIALGGTLVAVALLVMMVVGCFQFVDAYRNHQDAMNQVITLQNDNVIKRQVYENGYDLEDIHQKALALGMIPVEEAEVMYYSVQVPVREAEPTMWENITWFVNGLFA